VDEAGGALLGGEPGDAGGAPICLPPSARMPTQLTTAVDPMIAARVDSSSRMLAWIGSTWPTKP
jgi:hypothetical protein